ncbi:MAG TPA: hypothetical protein VF507_08410 [Pyrinomonadaceae bacterium]|jgi:hypothetical protein
MAKREAMEYQAKIIDDFGVVRGKIPSPLVRDMGGRAGDYMVFRMDEAGKVTASVSRTKKAIKRGRGAAGAKKSSGSKRR